MKRNQHSTHVPVLIGATLCVAAIFLFVTFFANPASSQTVDVLPVSDGISAWTPSSGTAHYALVDETTCNGSLDYNSINTVGIYETYNVNIDSIPSGSTINSITIIPCASANTPLTAGDTGSAVLRVSYRYNANTIVDGGNYVLSSTTPVLLTGTVFSGLSLAKNSTTKLQIGAVLSANTKKGVGARLSRIAAQISYTPPPLPTCSISANPSSIAQGGTVMLTEASANATSATLNGVSIAVSGTQSVNPATTTTYTMIVTGQGGMNKCATTVVVTPPPTCTLTPSATYVAAGTPVTFTKSSTNATTATFNGAATATSGTVSASPATTTTYIMSVSGQGGTGSCSATVTVAPPVAVTPPPTCTLTIAPQSINPGSSSTITWSSANASSVTLNGSAVSTSGTQIVSPIVSTTYALKVSGGGTTKTCSGAVYVVPSLSCTISANPPSVIPGAPTTLIWSSTNASSATFNGSAVSTSGSQVVTPTATTTTYTLNISGGGATKSCSTVVTVVPVDTQPLSCKMDVKPLQVQNSGETTYLVWTSTGANKITIDGVPSNYAGGKSVTVTSNPTTYTGVFSGLSGTTTCQVQVPIVAAACTVDSTSPQTETLSCPSGGAGSIVRTRYSICDPGATAPRWLDWSVVSDTCPTTEVQALSVGSDFTPATTPGSVYFSLTNYWQTLNTGSHNSPNPYLFSGLSASDTYKLYFSHIPGYTEKVGACTYTTKGGTCSAGTDLSTYTLPITCPSATSCYATVAPSPTAGTFVKVVVYYQPSLVEVAATCSLTPSVVFVAPGTPVTFTKSTANAYSASINGAATPLTGTLTVTPTITNTYRMSVSGQWGSGSCYATVTVQ